MPPRSPVPQEVSTELERVVRRWQQLPLDRALAHVAAVRAVLDELAAAPAPGEVVPDLGPAVVMDQLRVLVHDTCAAASAPGEGSTRHTDVTRLEHRLADLRRALG